MVVVVVVDNAVNAIFVDEVVAAVAIGEVC